MSRFLRLALLFATVLTGATPALAGPVVTARFGLHEVQPMMQLEALGFRIAGFSVNADDGATLSAVRVATRLRRVQAGDIVIAHMNKPAGGTAEGFVAALPELLRRGLRFIKLSEASLVPA